MTVKNLQVTFITFCFCMLGVYAAKPRSFLLPKPEITNIQENFASANSLVIVQGQGFVLNMPKAHKVKLQKFPPLKNKKGKKKKVKIKVSKSLKDELQLQMPARIPYGDYDLELKIRTKKLKSKKTFFQDAIKIRPQAPQTLKLKFNVIQSIEELDYLAENQYQKNTVINSSNIELDQDLQYEISQNQNLKLGDNYLHAYYEDQGYISLLSNGAHFLYLPQHQFQQNANSVLDEKPLIELISEKPLLAQVKLQEENGRELTIDVSEYLKIQKENLKHIYYLETPFDQQYLRTVIEIPAIEITDLVAIGDESVTLQNNSNESINLKTCVLKDSVAVRYRFEEDTFIEAKESYTLITKLSLNDTGSDGMYLHCPANFPAHDTEVEYEDEELSLITKLVY